MVTETRVDVRYLDADAMGIVHHSVYPVWYEVARMEHFIDLGFPYTQMQRHGINPAMVDLSVQFKASVSYPATVTIRTWCEAFGPKKIRLCYEAYDEAGKLVNTAATFHIWTGPDNRSIRLDEALPEVYAGIRAAVGTDKETL